jgi:hypothetical protein
MFDEERWAEVPAAIDSIEALARPWPGAFVLGACCGPGRHSLELASRGYRVTGKETAARDFTLGESFDRGGWGIRTEFSVVGPWEGLKNRWILSRGSEEVDNSFVIRLYSRTELREALLEAGFSKVEIFGGLDGSPYDQSATCLVALARA